MKRVTIYARVSTKEQNIGMQIYDLRAYAQAQGLGIVQEYIDYVNGIKSDRENYIRLFDDVRRERLLVFWFGVLIDFHVVQKS